MAAAPARTRSGVVTELWPTSACRDASEPAGEADAVAGADAQRHAREQRCPRHRGVRLHVQHDVRARGGQEIARRADGQVIQLTELLYQVAAEADGERDLAAIAEEIIAARVKGVPPAMYMTWQIPLGSALAAALIVIGASLLSLRRVLRLEPASVFR